MAVFLGRSWSLAGRGAAPLQAVGCAGYALQTDGATSTQRVVTSIAGGVLVGMGLLALFRHAASVGGFSALAVYLQSRRGWRAGHVLMAVDFAILLTAFAVIDPIHVLWSVVGAVALNLMVMLDHKPARYMTL